jgi:hypothetical protein
LLVLLLFASAAGGVERVRLGISNIRGAHWRAEDVALVLEARPEGWALDGRIGHLVLPPPLDGLKSIDFACPQIQIKDAAWVCADAAFHAGTAGLDRPEFHGGFSYRPGAPRAALWIDDLAVSGGRLRLRLTLYGEQWQASYVAAELGAARLSPVWTAAMGLNAGAKLTGRLDAEGKIDGRSGQADAATLDLRFQELRFAQPDGRRESQHLHGRVRLSAERHGHTWQGELRATATRGLLYLDPVLLDFGAEPVALRATGIWNEDRRHLALASFSLVASGLGDAHGHLGLDLRRGPTLDDAVLDVQSNHLAAVYDRLLRPWLLGTPLDALDLTGRLQVQVSYGDGNDSVTADLSGIGLVDRQGRFALSDLSGHAGWQATGARRSELQWASGHIYGLPFGAAQAVWEWTGDAIRLGAPLAVPVLGGSLQVDALQASGLGGPSATWELDAIVTPMEMPALSRALRWPAMAGQASAVIPRVRYSDHVLDIGGAVLLKVFDGDVVIRNLRVTRPLGLVPELTCDAILRGLDLHALTQAFSFGTITGRLEGAVRGLRLEDWEPVALDASFRTPPGDHSSHRIDQRAVRNLSSLGGGGMSAALSQGLLGLFDKFYYSRLGLSCRLAHGVCDMDGIAPATKGGFYIVEGGGGLPTLDVIGYTHRVDWNVLVERLRSAIENVPQIRP